MKRVCKEVPCPVCGKSDWCLVAEDGSAAICQRITDGSVKRCGEAGWLHLIDRNRKFQKHNHRYSSKISIDFSEQAKLYKSNLTEERLQWFSQQLKISANSLTNLNLGWDGKAFAFPMNDENSHIIGIRRRFPKGFKVCVEDSMNGLFIPQKLSGYGTLLIAEGNSDTAAGLDLGFDCIGRPNCSGGTDLIIRFLKLHTYQTIVVIPDNDIKSDGTNPGLTGGQRLAMRLRLYCPDVRLVVPPMGLDLREWYNKNLTRTELLTLIEKSSTLAMELIK